MNKKAKLFKLSSVVFSQTQIKGEIDKMKKRETQNMHGHNHAKESKRSDLEKFLDGAGDMVIDHPGIHINLAIDNYKKIFGEARSLRMDSLYARAAIDFAEKYDAVSKGPDSEANSKQKEIYGALLDYAKSQCKYFTKEGQ